MKNIYMVGIKGVGMTSLAVYLKERGKNVWGSDVDETFPTDSVLRENDIDVASGFAKEHIEDGIDLVITTGAHGGLENEEVLEAKRQNIPVYTHAYELGHVMDSFKHRIAVCGAHGKTTTSAMVAYVLHELRLPASHLIGASRFSGLYGGHYGGEEYLAVEADEYATSIGIDNTPRFMSLNPNIIICTNIDFDHPDVYPSIEEVKKAYLKFFQKLDRETGILIYNSEDKHLQEVVSKLELKHLLPYSSNDERINLLIPGKHNVSNAQSVVKLASILKLDKDKVLAALTSFHGVNRRFEKISEDLYDDYAHHPAEIEALVGAAREKFPDKRIILLFQPHTFSRTAALLSEFATALSHADQSIVIEVFSSAREIDTSHGTSQELVEEAHKQGQKNVTYSKKDELVANLMKIYKKGDIVITVGAGSIYESHSDIIRSLSEEGMGR